MCTEVCRWCTRLAGEGEAADEPAVGEQADVRVERERGVQLVDPHLPMLALTTAGILVSGWARPRDELTDLTDGAETLLRLQRDALVAVEASLTPDLASRARCSPSRSAASSRHVPAIDRLLTPDVSAPCVEPFVGRNGGERGGSGITRMRAANCRRS